MLLRRVVDHVKAQNWTAIALDFFIVVSGVFIGIQVSNWNGARLDKELAGLYAVRIYQDLASDVEKFRRADEAANKRMKQIGILSEIAENPERSFDPQVFLIALEESSWATYVRIEPGAYGELVTTGRTTLIEPVELRDRTAQYYAAVYKLDDIALDREPQRQFMAATTGMLSLRQLEAIEMAAWSKEQSLPDDMMMHAQEVAETFAGDPEATRWLPRMHQHQVFVKNSVAAHRARAEALMAEFERAYPVVKSTVQ